VTSELLSFYMMTCIIRKLRISFLLLAAFVFNAHMIIPHDHHNLGSDICQYPVSSGTHHQGFPYHCHAFNNLASEKTTTFVIIKYNQIANFIADCSTDIYNQPVHWVELYDNNRNGVISGFQEFTSLRAPPYLF